MKKVQVFSWTFVLLLLLTACQGSSESQTPAVDATPATAEADHTSSDSENEVTYVPAYPEDVSEQGLSDEDIAQQEAHSHGEDHSHDDGHHDHGDEDHDHGDHDHDHHDHDHGEDDHDQGDHEDHDHGDHHHDHDHDHGHSEGEEHDEH